MTVDASGRVGGKVAEAQQLVSDEFYTTVRMGAVRLSDGGGSFGFDITVALCVDELIRGYDCGGIIEPGCFSGDTTSYLARTYPDLPVMGCDLDRVVAEPTERRIRLLTNASAEDCDSRSLVERTLGKFELPLYFLDAYGFDGWPLTEELRLLDRGIVVIHDFSMAPSSSLRSDGWFGPARPSRWNGRRTSEPRASRPSAPPAWGLSGRFRCQSAPT